MVIFGKFIEFIQCGEFLLIVVNLSGVVNLQDGKFCQSAVYLSGMVYKI